MRVLPRGLGKYRINNKDVNIAEVETIVVSTDTLSFDDYLSSRALHLIAGIYHNSGVFDIVDYVLKKNNVSKSKIINALHQRVEDRSSHILMIVDEFIKDTKEELFDSEEKCEEFYTCEDNLLKVKNSEIGDNLLWRHIGVSFFKYWEDVVDELILSLNALLDIEAKVISDLRAYLLARIVNISAEKIEPIVSIAAETNFISEFSGIHSDDNCFLMKMLDESYDTVSRYKNSFHNNPTSWSVMLAKLRVHRFVRSDLCAAGDKREIMCGS